MINDRLDIAYCDTHLKSRYSHAQRLELNMNSTTKYLNLNDHRTKTRRRKAMTKLNISNFKLKVNSFLLINFTIIIALICSTQGSHNQQYIDSKNNNAIQSILLDTTEQSSLGWTKHPDGERAASRSPGWVEESFVNFERDINWRSFVVCDVAFNSVNNWLWTPYIERGDASRLYIEIKFTMRDCNLFPQMVLSCKETFALLYKEVDGPIGSASTPAQLQSQSQSNASFAQSDSYTLIDAIAAGEGRFTSNNDVVINTKIRSIPVSKRGVYFAFRDQGACLSLISIKVYHLRCPQQVVNFAHFNSTPTGRDLTSLVAVEGECVANSVQIEQPRMFCTADGQWNSMSSGQCKCLAGYEPAANSTKCLACPPGKFKWQLGDSHCQSCPERSFAPTAGANECKCHDGFYRSPRDPRWSPCTQPPTSGPSNLSATYVDSSLVVLQWQAPKFTGGREDLYYRLVCDSCSPADQQIVSSPPSTTTNFSETKCVLAGLQAGQTYRFLVYALNGVSQLAMHSQQAPVYSEITVQTAPKQTNTAPAGSLGSAASVAVGASDGQFQQQQQLPVFNFRAVPGARGTDMILAWETIGPAAAQSAAPESNSMTEEQLMSATLYEIKYQAVRGAADPFGNMVARRSPYALLSQQTGGGPSQLAEQPQTSGSLSTTNKVVGLYSLHPRTEYSFQIRAKLNGLTWTDWSDPLLASTGPPTASSLAPIYSPQPAAEPPAGLAPASQFLDVLGNQLMLPPPPPLQSVTGSNPLAGDQRSFLFQTPQSVPGAQSQPGSLLASVFGTIFGLAIVVALATITLVRYRKSPCLRSLASPFGAGNVAGVFGHHHHHHHSNGGSSSSTYAGVYSGAASNDLVVGANPFSSSTITTTANGNHLIYHNAAIAAQQQQQQPQYGLFSHLGSAGALITGSNSTSRSSSGGQQHAGGGNGPTGVVQSFLAATLGQLTNSGNNNHLQQNGAKGNSQQQHHHTINQDGKLFIHSADNMAHANATNNNGNNNNQHETIQTPRNHYHQMLGNVNHTLLFGHHQHPMATNNGPQLGPHFTTVNQQQLVGGGAAQQQQQQDYYSIRAPQRTGQQQQQRQQQQQPYGSLAATLGEQQHIYDDLDVVSQSGNISQQSSSPAHMQKQPLVGPIERQQQQQSALSIMMARELFDAQQQQQQQTISLGNVIGGRGQ